MVKSVKWCLLLWVVSDFTNAEFKIRVVNVQKVIEVPRSRIKSLDNISLIILVKRIHEFKSLS